MLFVYYSQRDNEIILFVIYCVFFVLCPSVFLCFCVQYFIEYILEYIHSFIFQFNQIYKRKLKKEKTKMLLFKQYFVYNFDNIHNILFQPPTIVLFLFFDFVFIYFKFKQIKLVSKN